MNLSQFVQKVELLSKTEIEKLKYLAYFNLTICQINEFTREQVREWFEELGLPRPNLSRLFGRLAKSTFFIKGNSPGSYRLHPKAIQELSAKLDFLNETSEEIVFSGSILPSSVFIDTRGYIEKLAMQINASYDNNLFDGCAVLMRRLLEILLIHTYQNLSIETTIQDGNGNYRELKVIIDDARNNSSVGLSRDAKVCIDGFRVLGNYSAHRIFYNCRRDDIKNIALQYRATIEELIYKARLK